MGRGFGKGASLVTPLDIFYDSLDLNVKSKLGHNFLGYLADLNVKSKLGHNFLGYLAYFICKKWK